LFDRHHDEVYAYCRRRTDAEAAADCVAETFLVAWRRLGDVPEGDAALGWLYGVARRTLANEYRRTRRWRRLLTRLRSTEAPVEPTPEMVLVRRERDRTVLAALARLRPQDQELLRLALWEELPHAEIADLLGCSTDAANHRIHRATRRAIKEYQRLDPHDGAETTRQLRRGETT
jgi:RNA polymerase sigma-70 factor (ECF subfamily)